jgi:hypothetical protein
MWLSAALMHQDRFLRRIVPFFRRRSVYQTSQYPSNENIIESASGLQSSGANASRSPSHVIRHSSLCGSALIGIRDATRALSCELREKLIEARSSDGPSSSNRRIGASFSSLRTCSSETRRYLPTSIVKNQPSTSTPSVRHFSQSRRSVNCRGRSSRFPSAVRWTGANFARVTRANGIPGFPQNKKYSICQQIKDLLYFSIDNTRFSPVAYEQLYEVLGPHNS